MHLRRYDRAILAQFCAILRNSSDALSTTSGLSKLEGALPVYQECIVRETCAVEVGLANVPRFRAVNEEVVRFDLGLAPVSYTHLTLPTKA